MQLGAPAPAFTWMFCFSSFCGLKVHRGPWRGQRNLCLDPPACPSHTHPAAGVRRPVVLRGPHTHRLRAHHYCLQRGGGPDDWAGPRGVLPPRVCARLQRQRAPAPGAQRGCSPSVAFLVPRVCVCATPHHWPLPWLLPGGPSHPTPPYPPEPEPLFLVLLCRRPALILSATAGTSLAPGRGSWGTGGPSAWERRWTLKAGAGSCSSR